jgi:Protein of unknown function (DUF3277)
MSTYSFINCAATITGPGGSFSLGYGSGNAKEGVRTEMIDDKDMMTTGADGSIMHSLRASNSGRIVVRLLKTSPVNAQLSALYNFQRTSSILWGQNVLVVSDVARGDVITGTQMAFVRQTPVVYSEDGDMNEWSFQGVTIDVLGTGVPSAN